MSDTGVTGPGDARVPDALHLSGLRELVARDEMRHLVVAGHEAVNVGWVGFINLTCPH